MAALLKKYSIYLLLAVTLGAHCLYLEILPKWDAWQYFNTLSVAANSLLTLPDISYLPARVLGNFNFFGHPSMGYALLMSLPQLIDLPNEYLLNLTNILLALLAVFGFYQIVRYFFRETTERLLLTAIFAFDPLFFGSTIFLNADFPLLVFLVCALASMLYNRKLLFFLSSLLLLFSKEPGILLYTGMAAGIFLYSALYLYGHIRLKQKIEWHRALPFNETDKPGLPHFLFKTACIVLPGALMLLYLAGNLHSLWVLNSAATGPRPHWNSFGFDFRIIYTRFFQIFGLNFHWVLSAAILVLLFLKRKKENWSDEKKWFIIILSFSFLCFVGFNLSYVTHLLPRYVLQGAFFLLIYMSVLLYRTGVRRSIRLTLLGLVLALFTLQTFRTVDPVSMLAYGTFPMGSHRLLMINDYPEAPEGWIYNTEFTASDKLFNLMNREIGITSNTVLITRKSLANFFFCDDNFYGTPKPSYIDRRTLRKTLRSKDSFQYRLLTLDALNPTNTPQEAWYVYRPWNYSTPAENSELETVGKFYQVMESKVVNYQGYTLNVHRLSRLTNEKP